jgi:hypothetical protein
MRGKGKDPFPFFIDTNQNREILSLDLLMEYNLLYCINEKNYRQVFNTDSLPTSK